MKKNHINILIQDTNRYFAQGLTDLLRTECQHRNTGVTFLTYTHRFQADVIIVTDDAPTIIQTCPPPAMQTRQKILLIQDRPRHRAASQAQPNIGVIQRRDSINSVIEQVFTKHPDNPAIEAFPDRPDLTPRESEVLSALARGLTPKRIARLFGLHAKTVSHHKRGAMRKLGLYRVHDLHQWLYNQDAQTSEQPHRRTVPVSGNASTPCRPLRSDG